MITVEPLFPDAILPDRQTPLAIGYDAHAYINNRHVKIFRPDNSWYEEYPAVSFHLAPNHRALIPFGFKAALPEGIEAQVRSRSGLALKYGVHVFNQPGTVDPDYTGEWAVILHNTSTWPFVINHGDRVAQIVLNKVCHLPWMAGEVVGERGGFGSTGV